MPDPSARIVACPWSQLLLWCVAGLLLLPGTARGDGEEAASFFVIQSRMDNNTRRKEKIEAEAEALEGTKKLLEGQRSQLEALRFDRARAQPAVDRLLNKLPKAAGRAALFDIRSAAEELLLQTIPPPLRRSPRPNASGVVQQLVADQEAPEGVPFDPPLEVTESDVRRNLEALQKNPSAAREAAAEVLGGPERGPVLLTALERIFQSAQRGRQREAEGYLRRIDEGAKTRRAEVAKLGDDIQQLGTQLSIRGTREAYLTYAIFAMICMLFALVALFAFFRQRVQERIVERRTLVELVALAFLILAIIILGTGEKIGKEVLGTLLGTIAGYIFGHNRPQQERKARIRSQVTRAAPAAPAVIPVANVTPGKARTRDAPPPAAPAPAALPAASITDTTLEERD